MNGVPNLSGLVSHLPISPLSIAPDFASDRLSLIFHDTPSTQEIDPKIDPDKIKNVTLEGIELPQIDQATQSFLSEIISSVPGIDEAMSFAQLMK